MSKRGDLLDALRARDRLIQRRSRAPMAWARLWDRAQPRTSQRRALAAMVEEGVMLTLILGGNRTGKSELMAMWALAKAAGRDATIRTERGPFRWVDRWLALNGLPKKLIQLRPGRVWVGSPTFGAAVEQIRPKLLRWAPKGSKTIRWDDKLSEAELHLPGGGVVVSKAYKQFDNDRQTWEGASIDGLALDEQPNRQENLTAGLSRLVDRCGQAVCALTPLRGKADWLYREVVKPAPPWLRVAKLHGEDNPHIPQAHRLLMLATMPKWQRASRDIGEFSSPEGRCFPTFDRSTHVVAPFPIPRDWQRWVGVDWGSRTAHIIWAAENRMGQLFVYRELAIRRTTQEPAMRTSQLIAQAKDLESVDAGSVIFRCADSEDPGAIEEAAAHGWLCEPIKKGAGSVLDGLDLLDALVTTIDPLTFAEQAPRLVFFSTCPVVISEMEELRWAEQKPGEPEGLPAAPDRRCSDHGPDAVRYIAMYRRDLGFV